MLFSHNKYKTLDSDDQLPDEDNAKPTRLNHAFPKDNSLSRSSLWNRSDSSVYELIKTPNIQTKESSDDAEQGNDPSFQNFKRHEREDRIALRPTERFGWFLRPVQKVWWGKNCSGWRMTVALCTLLTVVVLMVNIGITIWASKHRLQDGYRVLIEDDCAKSKSWSRWSHLVINFISTLLLGASNYTMQCLVSPTRAEVDSAHRDGSWVDIGIPSVRNFSRISRHRMFTWLLLGLSSLPLHLLFNSAVFGVTSGNSYWIAAVTEKFGQEARFNGTDIQLSDLDNPLLSIQDRNYFRAMQERVRAKRSTLEVLGGSEACLKEYQNPKLNKRGNLLIVYTGNTSQFSPHASYPIIDGPVKNDPLFWICGHRDDFAVPVCDTSQILKQVEEGEPWTIMDNSVKWCLSETFDEECRLQFSTSIMSVVIVCNALKAMAMALTLFLLSENPLATIGDAAASFLTDPDPNTKGHCLLSRSDMGSKSSRLSQTRNPRKWYSRHRYWWSAASRQRWFLCIALCLLTLLAVLVLLFRGLKSLEGTGTDTNLAGLWGLGFGEVNAKSLLRLGGRLNPDNKVFNYVLLANLPQLVLSFIYVMYSGLYTCMLLTREWVLYGTERKGLRTTYPQGQQRSTYYLQIPYAYSFPLIVASGLMHWLISQSIFLVAIDIYDHNHKFDKDTPKVITAGYSCIAIIFCLLMGTVMVVVCVGLGARKYPPGIPLAASCSAAISAACHAPEKDVDAAYLPVGWGEIPTDIDSNSAPDIGHCSLSSEKVISPTPDRLYAGL